MTEIPVRRQRMEIEYYVIPFALHQIYKQQFLDEITRATSTPVTEQGLQHISRTDYFVSFELNRTYMWLVKNRLYPYLEQALRPIFPKIELASFWFQQYQTGDFHGTHDHRGGQTNYSSVYYLEMTPESSGTRLVTDWGQEINPKVSEGDILIIPSTVKHYSPINKSTQTKTVLAMNIQLDNYPKFDRL